MRPRDHPHLFCRCECCIVNPGFFVDFFVDLLGVVGWAAWGRRKGYPYFHKRGFLSVTLTTSDVM
jgi:hypothetical protein